MATRATDLHRVFIQTMLARRFARDEVGLELYRRAVNAVRGGDEQYQPPHPMDKEGFQRFISEINDLLHGFGMTIQRGREETKNGKGFMVLVNTEADKISESATDFTPAQLGYFREVVSEIMESYPANSIGRMQALRLATEQETKIAKSVGETYLNAFVSRGWLAKSAFSIAPRGLVELEPYLAKEYANKIKKCHRCRKMLLSGKACASRDCDVHFHSYCLSGMKRATCPSCSVSYDQVKPVYIGEKAVPRAEDDFTGRNRKRRRQGANGRNEEEEDGESDMESEEGQDQADDQTQSQDRTQMTQAGAGSSRWVASGRSKRGRTSVIPETQLDSD